jgi:hypothetical protein
MLASMTTFHIAGMDKLCITRQQPVSEKGPYQACDGIGFYEGKYFDGPEGLVNL